MNRLCIRGIVGGAVAFIYVTTPSQQNFDATYAPDSPPMASVISSSTGTGGQVWDTVGDTPIDVRPPYSVKIIRLSSA